MNFKNNLPVILYVIVACIVSRLLFQDTNVFFIDGDEAIVGLMGIDILNGDLPFYFYGQNYGLAFFEAVFVSIGIAMFGTTMAAVKIPMLFMWCLSVVFIALSFLKLFKGNKLLTLLFISILIFSPTWLVWSLKARGGYLTSFFFTSLSMYLLIKNDTKIKYWIWLLIGAFAMIVYDAQPLWLPGLLPIIAYYIFKQKEPVIAKAKSSGLFVAGFGLVYGITAFLKSGLYVAWKTPAPNMKARLGLIADIPSVLLETLGGNYFLSSSYEPSNSAFSNLFILCFIVMSILSISYTVRSKKIHFSTILFLSSLFSFSGFLVKSEPRYLLPFFGFALFTIVVAFIESDKKNWKKIMVGGFSITLIAAVASLSTFKEYSYINMSITERDSRVVDDKKIMEDLINELERYNVKYVYSTNEFIAYQINYMTNNKITAISRKDRFRIPKYVDIVDEGYATTGSNNFAVVGYNFGGRYTNKLPMKGNKVYYIIKPDAATLKAIGYTSTE